MNRSLNQERPIFQQVAEQLAEILNISLNELRDLILKEKANEHFN